MFIVQLVQSAFKDH